MTYAIGTPVTLQDNRHWTGRPKLEVLDSRLEQGRTQYLLDVSPGNDPVWIDSADVDGPPPPDQLTAINQEGSRS